MQIITEKAEYSEYSKEDYMQVAKQFIKYCYKKGFVDALPRNFDDKELVFRKTARQPQIFTVEEVKHLLDNATDRTQLYMLLMLNTGMTQKDISDLLISEVDLDAGTITRKRSKTRDNENVPTVCYPLWKRTLALLTKFANNDGDRILTNRNGSHLKVERLKVKSGKDSISKWDNIACNYRRLLAKLEKKGIIIKKSLKVFRKTANSQLKNNPQYAHYALFFMGHS